MRAIAQGALAAATMLGACAAAPQQPVGAASAPPPPANAAADDAVGEDPLKKAAFDAAMDEADERQRVFADATDGLGLKGNFAQGGLVSGKAAPGSLVRLDGEPVMTDAEGRFIIGFGREAGATAFLTVTPPGGPTLRRALEIADRDFKVERIDGLDQSKVSGFTPEQLAKIAADREKKNAARATTTPTAWWSAGFDWPLTGRISGVFGSQRILNGEEKTPHSGVDVAAGTGTPVRAPAGGVVRLAEPDMYFEGGLVLIDHGLWIESAFLHLSRLDVKPGDAVEKGQVIGAVGATGRATGPHMHWSLKWAGTLVDPQLEVGPMPAAATAPAGN